jgi:SAM-dependent methyltransferase
MVDGIPVIVDGESDVTGQQAAFFDETGDSDFEIERPVGAPALYDWLLGEKFRLGIAGVSVHGRTALVVCGGSGMDAEFLARAGADVVSSDISLGAARRTVERSRRHGVAIAPLVANAERLPFADRSVDIVYVHDGLHHLERPLVGLADMARVARLAVCVTEPARAAATAAAATIGLAENVEEAGNRVARLTLAEVQETLERYGFRITCARRYAMFYRHEPGPAMRALSRPVLFPIARTAFRLANVPLARIGNKLAVTAVRA